MGGDGGYGTQEHSLSCTMVPGRASHVGSNPRGPTMHEFRNAEPHRVQMVGFPV